MTSTFLDAEMVRNSLMVPTVLKIDIEGAEILALRGARKLLSGLFGPKPRVVFLEVHPKFLPAFNAVVEDVYELMENCGYSRTSSRVRDDQLHEVYQPRPS
jgi:Methyltransferase FkbM domain